MKNGKNVEIYQKKNTSHLTNFSFLLIANINFFKIFLYDTIFTNL